MQSFILCRKHPQNITFTLVFKRDLNRIYGLILFFSIFVRPLFTQNVVIKHYGVNQGLPSSETYWVTQDSKGYMWIATDAGVVKYDGYKFNTYNTTKGLPDNTVFKIREDKYGRIWFASYSGKMAYYLHQTDSIYEIAGNEQLSELIKVGIADFAFDEKDTLFISAAREGYIKVTPPDYRIIKPYRFSRSTFFLRMFNNKQLLYGSYFDFTQKAESKIPVFLATEKKHFYDDTLFKMAGEVNYFSTSRLSDSSVLFCDHRSIARISKRSKKILLDSLPFKNDIIITIFKDQQSRVWVNTHSNGTALYDTLKTNSKPRRFLENRSVTSVFEDKEHGFWLTTLEDGLYYIPSLNFEFINQTPEIKFDKVHSLCVRNNRISFLTGDGFFYQLDATTKKVLKEIKMTKASAYILGYDQKLLICNQRTIITDELGDNHLPLAFRLQKNLSNTDVRVKKAYDFDENYLIGYYDGNVVKIEKKTGKADVIIEKLPTIFSIYSMNDVIWLGTKLGLYSYSNNQMNYHGTKSTMLKKRIDGIVHVGNKLFLATRGYGVLCYENGKITHRYSELDGLASNLCKTIIKDSLGNIWVGTNRGVSRLKPEKNGTYSVNTMNLSNGLVSSEVNQMVIYQSNLYLATNTGLAIVKIADAFNSTISIPVYIESFLVNNIKSDHSKNKIYNYYENFMKIGFKGIYAKAEGDIKYKYRLEGLDTNWTYSKNTFVQYTTLPAGKYKFIVYAINFDGKLSESPATIYFEINPPFWKTWWFILVCMGLVSFVIYFLYSRRIRLIQKQEEQKTRFYKQIAESELKALRAQMNPHFMFNAINSIQTFVLLNDSKSAQKYLTKFSRLIRSVLENSKHEVIPLSKEIETLSLYIELECLRASFSFDYDLKVNNSVRPDIVQIPPMLLQPYIENAILHGLKPLKGKKGFLQVEFWYENSALKCIIEDNGVGRKRAMELKEKKKASHQSMGMAVTQDRLDVLSKSNFFRTQVHIIDKFENEIASGTRVEINIEYLNKNI